MHLNDVDLEDPVAGEMRCGIYGRTRGKAPGVGTGAHCETCAMRKQRCGANAEMGLRSRAHRHFDIADDSLCAIGQE